MVFVMIISLISDSLILMKKLSYHIGLKIKLMEFSFAEQPVNLQLLLEMKRRDWFVLVLRR